MLRQIFYLSSTSLTVYHWDGREISHIANYIDADAGLAYFDDYIQQFNDVPALVLTDFVEEDFRVESVPHTFGADRKAMLERHVTRLYRGTQYRHAEHLGKDPHEKRKDKVLFSGILNSELADMWLDAFTHHKVPVQGVYSLPIISSKLSAKLCTHPEYLFVSHNIASGLRQSFYSKGKLHFSRLTPIKYTLSSEDYARFIHTEISKTRRYLNNLHILERDSILNVCMTIDSNRLPALEATQDNETLTHYEMYSIEDAAHKIGYKHIAHATHSDELFCYLVSKHRFPNHYASPEQLQQNRLHKTHTGIKAASLLLILGGILWSGANISDGFLFKEQIEKTSALQAASEDRLANLQARIPESAISAEDIQLAVSTAEDLRQQGRTPEKLMETLGQALLRYPGLQLDRIEWFVSDTDSQTEVPEIGANDTDDMLYEEEYYDDSSDDYDESLIEQRYQIAVLHGKVIPFDGDFLRAHRLIEQLLNELSVTNGITQAEAVSMPLNTASSGKVAGGLGQDVQEPEAKFQIRFVLGEGHA